MSQVFPELSAPLIEFIERQKLFFIATAPSGRDGHVNCSPRGLDSLRVLGPRSVAWLDFTGSGVETIAHLRDNGRIVIMLCEFEAAPRIVRMHGRGSVHSPGSPRFSELLPRFREGPGMRAIVEVELTRIADSCGYGVPRMRYEGDRDTLARWAENRGEEGLVRYRREKNATSLDGLPGLDPVADAAAPSTPDPPL